MPRAAALSQILDEDRDLAEGLVGARLSVARRRAVAPVLSLERGPVELQAAYGDANGWLGLLILDGLVLHEVSVLGRSTTEVLGAGDVLCPWEIETEVGLPDSDVSFIVLTPARIGLLDSGFAERVRPWSEIASAVVGRVARRSESQGLARALGNYPRVDVRLVGALWDLARRFGTVLEDDMVLLPLPLTHEILARIVGCHRRSVTAALSGLRRDGLISRDPSGWLLHGTLPLQLEFILTRSSRQQPQFSVLPGGGRRSAARRFHHRSTG